MFIVKLEDQRPVNAHLTPGPGIYFNAFLHVYSPRAGEDNPLGINVDVNRKPLTLCPFVAGLKKMALKSDFIYIFFMFHHMYIATGRGRQSIGDKILMTTERPLPTCCKFQNDLFEFWFYTHFLIILYMYIAPGQGQTNPWRQNFDVNRKLLPLQPFVASSLCPYVASFKMISLNSDFTHIF